jgi:uncharacterized protein YbjT (DUF2867 family)
MPKGNFVSFDTKPIPGTVAVFGANAHIGKPLARFLRFKAPQLKLRLISSNPQTTASLRNEFPEAEAAHASYFDRPSLDAALAGVEGIFVVTPTYIDERVAMTNLVASVKKAGSVTHVVRIVGHEPEQTLDRVPQALRDFGSGTATQHFIAREILDASGLPVTCLNIGASYMDNFIRIAEITRRTRSLVWPQRYIPYIDPREVGEIAARLLLSPDRRYIHQFLTINNGHDLLTSDAVATMMSDVLVETISHDGSKEAFLREFTGIWEKRYNRKGVAEYLWDFFAYEAENSAFQSLNDLAERILQRKPMTLRAFFKEHRQLLC